MEYMMLRAAHDKAATRCLDYAYPPPADTCWIPPDCVYDVANITRGVPHPALTPEEVNLLAANYRTKEEEEAKDDGAAEEKAEE